MEQGTTEKCKCQRYVERFRRDDKKQFNTLGRMAIFVWWKNTDFVEEKSLLFWGVMALPDQQRTQSIQEMDLHRISSMRRNQIISDVFL